MTTKLNAVIVFGLLCLLVSCAKKTERLVAGIWQVQKIEYSIDGAPFEEQDLNCNADDSWIFSRNGQLKIVSGLDLCGDGNPFIGNWVLDETQTKIIITSDEFVGEDERTIIHLDRKTLITEHDLGFEGISLCRFHFSAF